MDPLVMTLAQKMGDLAANLQSSGQFLMKKLFLIQRLPGSVQEEYCGSKPGATGGRALRGFYRSKKPTLCEKPQILISASNQSLGAPSGSLSSPKISRNLWNNNIKKSIITQIDAKTKLQELSLKNFKSLPVYKLVSNTGPRHKPLFKVGVKLIDTKFFISEGKSKKEAEQNAAFKCLQNIKIL